VPSSKYSLFIDWGTLSYGKGYLYTWRTFILYKLYLIIIIIIISSLRKKCRMKMSEES